MNQSGKLPRSKTIPILRPWALLAVLSSAMVSHTVAGTPVPITGVVIQKYFDNFTSSTPEDLLTDPRYPSTPTYQTFEPNFEYPPSVGPYVAPAVNNNEAGDNYGNELSGLFIAPTTGSYVFYICSDDQSSLYLSTDSNPANKQLIAAESAWSNPHQYLTSGGSSDLTQKASNQNPNTTWATRDQVNGGALINLTAGSAYYIEALHHEGGGGDNVSVAVQLPGDPAIADGAPAIPGKYIQNLVDTNGTTLAITQQPQSVSLLEQRAATFTVGYSANSTFFGNKASVQWQRNGTNITGATSTTYTLPVTSLADSGAKFHAVVSIANVASQTSTDATLTVLPDTNPPQVLSVGSIKNGNNNNTEVTVVFDKPLKDATTATTLANYSLSSGTITAASYVTNSSGVNTHPNQSGVVLTATGVTAGQNNTLTIKNISDVKGDTLTSTNVSFTAGSQTWISIGTVAEFTPHTFVVGTNGYNLVSGGNAFWGTEDDITMVYDSITGDFDKIAQVEYTDPASNWARSGISARKSLNNGDVTTDGTGNNPASAYQMVISDPAIKFDGTAGNDAYETNRRLNDGDPTTSSNARGNPTYPDSWIRLKRTGQWFDMYFAIQGTGGTVWSSIGRTDFSDSTLANSPMPDQLFVGPTYGPENNNISTDTNSPLRGLWSTRIRNYGDLPQKARGSETYALGLNFGADYAGAGLSSNDVAGVDAIAQGNWNNIVGQSTPTAGPVSGIVAESAGKATATSVTVDWTSNNTWASEGNGVGENNLLPEADGALMTGYLDSGAATTTTAKIANLPSQLTSSGYDVYVYLLSDTGQTGDKGRGGGYQITDGSGTSLTGDWVRAYVMDTPTNWVRVLSNNGTNYSVGNYIVFTNLKSSTIIVQASTDNGLASGGTPRAPINAVQLVPTGSGGGGGGGTPTLSVARSSGGITLTFTGTLQSSDKVNGPYTDVSGASPVAAQTTGPAKFYRARQ